ncbi:MAG TPA: hypothetical protein VJ302_27605 [Blastocatellia bacterium]|nr:hypothetical protein [Blastocatellia bacterium]
MRTRRRRARRADPLTKPTRVRAICEELRRSLPDLIPRTERQLFSLLNAVRHIGRYSATETSKGRPAHWDRETLVKVAHQLEAILERETAGRVSVSSFVGLYLRVLHFPADVLSALERGGINLQEATLLARLTHVRLQTDSNSARATRHRVLKAHLDSGGSQNQLRARVREILGESALISSETLAVGMQKSDALLGVDPEDAGHLFFETMKDLFYAIRRFDPDDLDETDIAEFMLSADLLSNTIHSIEQRIKGRSQPRKQHEAFGQEPERGPHPVVDQDAEGRITYGFK